MIYSYDDVGPHRAGSDFRRSHTRTARKDYRCQDCGKAIPAGTRYTERVGKEDGMFYYQRVHTATGACIPYD